MKYLRTSFVSDFFELLNFTLLFMKTLKNENILITLLWNIAYQNLIFLQINNNWYFYLIEYISFKSFNGGFPFSEVYQEVLQKKLLL